MVIKIFLTLGSIEASIKKLIIYKNFGMVCVIKNLFQQFLNIPLFDLVH